MKPIKCTCGNKGCTTEITISHGVNYIDLRIVHTEKDAEKEETIMLDPNAIVYLISQLKQSLMKMA